MTEKKQSYLAFRVYGDFHWPPVGGQYDASIPEPNERHRGVVEIYYATADRDVAQPYEAVVRWVPETAGMPIPPPWSDDPATLPALQEVTDAEIKAAFQSGKEIVAYRLTRAANVIRDRHLLFRGASLIEQYAFDARALVEQAQPTAPPPQFRLVLARSFHHARKLYFSEVVLGQPDDDVTSGCRIRFNLAIPTPWPQSGADADNCFALPFAAIFNPKYTPKFEKQVAEPPPVEAVIAGPGPKSATQDIRVLLASVTLNSRRLGSFDLCRPKNGDPRFLYLPRKNNADLSPYWLTDRSTFLTRFLAKLSPPAAKGEDRFLLSSDDPIDERLHSVRFQSRGDCLIFRVRLRAHSVGHITRDIKVKHHGGGFQFLLRLPGHADRWIVVGKELTIECEVVHRAGTEQLWTASNDATAGELTIRLGWTEEIDAAALAQEDANSLESAGRHLARAVRSMRLTRLGLRNEMSELSQTFLPEIVADSNLTVRFMLCGRKRFDVDPAQQIDCLQWGQEPPRRQVWPGLELHVSLWPEDRLLKDEAKTEVTVPVKLVFETFQPAGAVLDAAIVNDVNAARSNAGALFQFRIEPARFGPDIAASLGSLMFRMQQDQTPAEKNDDYSFWRFNPSAGQPSALPYGQVGTFFLADLDFRLRLTLSAVRPLGAERLWGDRFARQSPILIPIDERSDAGKFILDVRETVSRTSDRRLVARLLDRDLQAGGESRPYLSISEEPFSIVKFWSEPLQQRGTQETAEVAVYDSDTRAWIFKLAGETYHYEYPPQSVGESMDKPGRLEIEDADLANGATANWPAVSDLRHRAVEYRLTPSAELWVRPTDVEQNYFLPEWATYQLFRQQGALGIGVALTAFRAEFIYGLPVGIDPSRETGAARTTRVAEIEALTGRPPQRIEASTISGASPARWLALKKALDRRPERLELWARDADSKLPFSPARFTTGARFALRNTALHRPALEAIDARNVPKDLSVRLSNEGGLSGGALWGLESANFIEALLADPVAVGGHIERIALSPTGGDGDQRVEFIGGLLAIVSETRNGYVQRVRLEILGRIAVFWHRAKHVIVYERSVSASAQFTPIGDLKRTRRPVLRKVNEYVELLQPTRSYPDFPKADGAYTGFLRAVRFNSRIINVDSAWSEELGNFGFKVPLWNRHAAVVRPQVYPRPDIAFVTEAEGEGERPQASQECLDVDHMYFFADATSGPDSDTWPARLAIDYTNLPRPEHSLECQPQVEPSSGRQPSPSRVPRGHRNFTFRLAPCAQRAKLNAQRGEEPVFVGVESVTFMRSTMEQQPSVRDKVCRDAMQIGAPSRLGRWDEEAGAPRELAKLDAAIREFDDAQSDDAVLAAGKKLHQELAVFESDIKQGRFKKHLSVLRESKPKFTELLKLAEDAPGRCEQIVTDFSSSLKQKRQLILENMRGWERQIDVCLPKPGTVLSKEKLIEGIVDEVMDLLRPSLDGMGRSVGGLQTSVAAAKSIVLDVESDIESALTSARSEVGAFKSQYDTKKPWSLQRLVEFDETLRGVRDGVVCEAIAAVDEARSRLATELDQFAQAIGSAVTGVLQEIADEKSEILGALHVEASAAQQLFATVDRFLGTILGEQATDYFTKLQAAIDQAIKADTAGKYHKQLQDVKQAVDTLRSKIKALRAELREQAGLVASTAQGLERALDRCGKQLTDIVRDAQAFAGDALIKIGEIIDGPVVELKKALIAGVDEVTTTVASTVRGAFNALADLGAIVDKMIDAASTGIENAIEKVSYCRGKAFKFIDDGFASTDAKLGTLREAIGPTAIRGHFIEPAVIQLLQPIDWTEPTEITEEIFAQLHGYLKNLRAQLEATFDKLSLKALGSATVEAQEACRQLGGSIQDAFKYFDTAADQLEQQTAGLVAGLKQALADIEKLKALQKKIGGELRAIANGLSEGYSRVTAYADRVLDSIGKLDSGGLVAAPNNLLKLYAAVATAPALPNLEYNCKRLKYYYNELNKIIDTTPAEAWFGRLGDALKALGLSLPFDQIGDRLMVSDVSKFDIGRLFKNFSGLKLDKLFKGYKLPKSARDAIKVTHAFDKQQFRAWVQIDVDLPLPGRRSLFHIGPVQLDFVNSRLLAQVRLEASKDTDKVEQTGRADLRTDVEAVVGGQSMVTLQKVSLRYEKTSGLDVVFDPRNIKLNPVFRFIQEALGTLFPDEVGGMKVLKNDLGIPVGVEHEFSMPPISINFATSGVSNLQIANRFALVAYPDFVISDRFSLSRPELPFIFSIFIIGGTGYVTVDVEYRPFRDQLMVMVEAAAGGSAAIGFAFGPVRGSVFIAISIALSYRKLIGSRGGGLTVSLVLLVAGNVDVAGIVTVYMGLLMRMAYRDGGRIDATGTLTITIRISRFFKLRARANAQYKLRDGKSTTTTSTSAGLQAQGQAGALVDAYSKAKNLMEARG